MAWLKEAETLLAPSPWLRNSLQPKKSCVLQKKTKKTAGLLKSHFHLLLQVIITNEVLHRSYKLTSLFRNQSVKAC